MAIRRTVAVAAAGDGGTPVVLAHPESAPAVVFRRLGELVANGLAL